MAYIGLDGELGTVFVVDGFNLLCRFVVFGCTVYLFCKKKTFLLKILICHSDKNTLSLQ